MRTALMCGIAAMALAQVRLGGRGRRRVLMYEDYVRSAAEHPAFVGCHFFKYGDEPLTGRGDGENFNIGFTSVTDSVYPEMSGAAKAMHAEIYRIRTAPPRTKEQN